MEFKVGSLMNLISGKPDSNVLTSQPTEQKIVFQQKPNLASARKSAAKKEKKAYNDKKSLKQHNDSRSPKSRKSMAKNSGSNLSSNFKETFRRGTLNKSFKKLRIMQGSKPEVAESTSQTVKGKSFKYIDSENTSYTQDTTDGPANQDKEERTVFIGNLPLTKTSQTAITKMFAEFGEIESFRRRSIPLKDLRVPKKVAGIKSHFHPDRTSTNAYIVMKSKDAAEAALALDGAILDNHHLRIDKASSLGNKDPRKAIFLGNVSFKAEEDDLWALFEQCGDIDYVRILRDQKTSVSKGTAYVNFKSADSVELALRMEGAAEIHGRPLKIHRCLPGRIKTLHTATSRQPGPRNTDETKDGKARTEEEKRFRKKMKRREKREVENTKNEALGLRSRPLKDPATSTSSAKSYVGVKAEVQQLKRKKKRINKGDVQRKKIAKILASATPQVHKNEEPLKVVEIDAQPNPSVAAEKTRGNLESSKKKKNQLSKVMKKAAPKTILIKENGEINKKKLKKVKTAPKAEQNGETKKKSKIGKN